MIPDTSARLPGLPTRHVILLQALSAAPQRVAAALDGLPEPAFAWRSAPEDWCARELVSHLASAEDPFLARLRRLQAEANPWLPYFGPEVARPDVAGYLAAHLERFRSRRDATVRFLCDLTADDWERPGVHETMGPTTLAQQAQNLANHDAEHLSQLLDWRQAWESQPHD